MHRSTLLKSLALLLILFGAVSCDSAGPRSFQAFYSGETATPAVTLTLRPSLTLADTSTSFQPLPTSTRTLAPSITPTFTLTSTSPLTPTSTLTSTSTLVPTDTDTPQPTLPEEHYISDIRGHRQFFPLGCEAAAAKDWANYFGKDFNEYEFQFRLPISDNPDYGFVGDVNGPWARCRPMPMASTPVRSSTF